MSLDLAASRDALTSRVLASSETRGVIRAHGPDAFSFLQGQLSQDLEAIRLGGSAEALVLSPQGKLEALVHVVHGLADEWLVVCPPGVEQATLDRLRRFKIRVKVELDLETWSWSLLLGPAGDPPLMAPVLEELVDATKTLGVEVYALELAWPGLAGAALLTNLAAGPVVAEHLDEIDPAALESLRIAAGIPVAPNELDENTIAEEAGLVARTVSFTKGCYTGQELVARLDARGNNVARRLRLVEIAATDLVPTPGDQLIAEGKPIGSLTSVARDEHGGFRALGYFRRAVLPPVAVELQRPDGATYAAVVLETPVP